MPHVHARLTEYARLLAVRRVEQGHGPGEVAKQLGVSRQTIYEWVRRHREQGVGGLIDRSSRPHRSPRRTPLEVELRIVRTRLDEHAGPVTLSGRHRLAQQRPAHRRLDRLPRPRRHSTRPLRPRRPTTDQPTRRMTTVNNVPGIDS